MMYSEVLSPRDAAFFHSFLIGVFPLFGSGGPSRASPLRAPGEYPPASAPPAPGPFRRGAMAPSGGHLVERPRERLAGRERSSRGYGGEGRFSPGKRRLWLGVEGKGKGTPLCSRRLHTPLLWREMRFPASPHTCLCCPFSPHPNKRQTSPSPHTTLRALLPAVRNQQLPTMLCPKYFAIKT